MQGMANRIKRLRKKSGKSNVEMADVLSISVCEYDDLESYDDEIIDAITIKKVKNIASIYEMSLIELLIPEKENWPKTYCSDEMMVNKVREIIKEKNITIEEAEEQVGWCLGEFLSSPASFVEKNPIMFIKDLASFIGVQWQCAIPRQDFHG